MKIGDIIRIRKWRNYLAPGTWIERGFDGKNRKLKDRVAVFTYLGEESLADGEPELDPQLCMYAMGYTTTLRWPKIKAVLDTCMSDEPDDFKEELAKEIAELQWPDEKMIAKFKEVGHDPHAV